MGHRDKALADKQRGDCRIIHDSNPYFLVCQRTAILLLARRTYGYSGRSKQMDALARLFWWLFYGSGGAPTRVEVLNAVKEQPRNAMQLSQTLSLDYSTIRHHLEILEKNGIVKTEGKRYGKLYFVSELMDANWDKLERIIGPKAHYTEHGDGTLQIQGRIHQQLALIERNNHSKIWDAVYGLIPLSSERFTIG